MTTLITGATGFVGTHLAAYLASESGAGPIVRVARRPTHGMVECDLVSFDQTRKLLRDAKPSLVYHLAATFTEDFEDSFRTNVLAARNLLEIISHDCFRTRVVLIGSAAEYGLISESDNPVTESQVLRPYTMYGWTKAAQSQLAPVYARTRGVDVLVARLFNLTGRNAPERLFVGRAQRQIDDVKAGRAQRISVGSLSAKRDYLDVGRACELLHAVAARGLAGEVYNLGAGRPVQMRDLLDAMLKANGMDWSLVDEQTYTKPGGLPEVAVICADTTKLNKLIDGGGGA